MGNNGISWSRREEIEYTESDLYRMYDIYIREGHYKAMDPNRMLYLISKMYNFFNDGTEGGYKRVQNLKKVSEIICAKLN